MDGTHIVRVQFLTLSRTEVEGAQSLVADAVGVGREDVRRGSSVLETA